MPHCVILYTPNVDARTDMTALCRALADAMLTVTDESGAQVFPTGGTRVLAYPAAHYAVADGKGDYAFVYLNVRMAQGRSSAVKTLAGDTLIAVVKQHFAPIFDALPIGITLQIDESPQQVFDAKHSSLHPLFAAGMPAQGQVLHAVTPAQGGAHGAVVPAQAGIEGGSGEAPPARG